MTAIIVAIMVATYIVVAILVYLVGFSIACRAYHREGEPVKFNLWFYQMTDWFDLILTCTLFWPISIPVLAVLTVLRFITKLIKKSNGISE